MRRLLLIPLLLATVGCRSGALPPGNRLDRARSPYLRQHASNLVHWREWNEESLAEARQQNKPIFLSVGYSTCHWCHVMARESFMDPGIAARLNSQFIPIKVDREERPDVDALYMDFLVKTTGSGGWPMTVFLTPDLRPFYGGTYYAPPRLAEVLDKVGDLWLHQRPRVEQSAAEMSQLLATRPDRPEAVEGALAQSALRSLAASYDGEFGGFGSAPKFPRPANLALLLRCGDEKQRGMALETLRQMARGGIHDGLGGGFHRYSTDRRWRVPHFEKMLYDQAQLSEVYLDAYALTDEPGFAAAARSTLDYVLRDMTAAGGGFYSAEDADSARGASHAEGAFYVWTQDELDAALPPELRPAAHRILGVQPGGNVEQDSSGELKGYNVLYLAQSGPELERIRALLEAVRRKRPRPARDEKILTAWNGTMIAALARAATLLQEPRYLAAAEKASAYLEREHWRDGRLFRYSLGGTAPVPAFCEDYSELIHGLLALRAASQQPHPLELARAIQERQLADFWDATGGGFFETDGRDKSIMVRAKRAQEDATWSGNARAVLNLVELARLSDDPRLEERARQTVAAFAALLKEAPLAAPGMLVSLDALSAREDLMVLRGPDGPELSEATRSASLGFHPNRLVLRADRFPLAYLKDLPPAAQVEMLRCQGRTCGLPVRGLTAIRKELGRP